MRRLEILAMLICFTAVVVIAISAKKEDEASIDVALAANNLDDLTFVGLLCALAASIFLSFAAVSVRKIKSMPLSVIVFWFAFFGAIFSAAFIGTEVSINGSEAFRLSGYSQRQIMIAGGAALLDTGALVTSNLALQLGSAGFVSLFTYMNIVYAFLIDVFFFEEQFNTVVLIASVVIMAVALIAAIFKNFS